MLKTYSSTFIKTLLIATLSTWINSSAFSQQTLGFTLPDGEKKVEIPFQQINNLIIVPVTINGMVIVKFVVDTGAESAILTEKILGDYLSLNYVRTITLNAPGIQNYITAHVATNISLRLPNEVYGVGLNMLVLQDDYLELSENLGEEVYGILGYDLFSRFVVTINYDAGVLTLREPESIKPKKLGYKIPLEIIDTKPYIHVKVRQKNKVEHLKLMIDTGASHSLLLDLNDTEYIKVPKKVITTTLGHGLGGEIPGLMGRTSSCEFGVMKFDDVLSSFPSDSVYNQAIKRGSRHGTMGGELLQRLSVTFDYQNHRMYLKRGENYKNPFDFNMSGMLLRVEGLGLDTIRVHRIMPNSPAESTGINEGDQILKINGLNTKNSSISEINALLRKRSGLRITVIINQDGERVKKQFRLKRLI